MNERPFIARILCTVLAAILVVGGAFAAEKAKSKPKAKPKAKASAEKAPDIPNLMDLPWNLRDKYDFDFPNAKIIYGADNAQWSLEVPGIGTLFDRLHTKVTLGDGKVIDVNAFGPGTTTRDKVTTIFGEGRDFSVELPDKEGIHVRHSLTINKASPFHAFHVKITNTSQAPIEISKITVMDVPPGSLAGLSADTEVHMRRLRSLGLSPVFDPQAAPMIMMIQDRAKGFFCAIGTVPAGKGTTGINLQVHSGTWQGDVSTAFEPAVRLDPGETIESDPVWISLSIPQPSELDRQFAYMCSGLSQPPSAAEVPPAWVTLGDGDSLDDLRRVVSAWKESGVRHVLVPSGWEGVPGSLEGASPRFPKNMANVASEFRGQEWQPGITVDPLAVQGGDSAWTATSTDGQRWLNPLHEKGFEYGVEQMKKVAGWGYTFIVVEPSLIPNEVLKAFKLSRAHAESLAYAMVAKAAPSVPVLQKSRATLGPELDGWLSAAAATARMREFNVPVGAVRLDASKVDSLPADTLTAMAFCGAPIELTGSPTRTLQNQCSRIFPKAYLWPKPVDASAPTPKLWIVEINKNKDTVPSVATVSFPGARALDASDPQPEATDGRIVWATDSASFLKKFRHPNAEK
ncbi:MAG: hypothetical protein K1Y02_16290 [Candidatus Hydrogenedentes bacterium]|nr:hypothetical protein [Candidatus Hydrogenedentota bacterium]